jgi:hypothetical protein
MPARSKRSRLGVEWLEPRLALSLTVAAPAIDFSGANGAVPADRNRSFTPADLQAYTKAYQSHIGQPNYNPAYDFNGTGYIGQNDARPILRGLAAITRHLRFRIEMNLAPGEQIMGRHPINSGGVTYKKDVTVIGHTTPNSIVFTDNIGGAVPANFKFQGPAVVANAKGAFTVSYKLGIGLTQTNYLIFTPFGQQQIHAFPIEVVPT